jgi:RNA polymerase sigma-70 factor (ECF subfamily)
MSEDDDAATVRDCLSGNRQAFATLVGHYEKPVFNVALRMLRNPEDASDVSQTVFLKAYQNLSSYDPQYKFYSWIYRMAINESLNILRVRGRNVGPVDDQLPTGEPGPAESLASSEDRDTVLAAIDRLKPEYRAVIVLRYFADQSYEDMGQTLGIDARTVKSRLFTARQLLKDLLASEGAP